MQYVWFTYYGKLSTLIYIIITVIVIKKKTFVQSDWLELFKWERPLKALKLLPEFNRSFWSTFQVPLPRILTLHIMTRFQILTVFKEKVQKDSKILKGLQKLPNSKFPGYLRICVFKLNFLSMGSYINHEGEGFKNTQKLTTCFKDDPYFDCHWTYFHLG